jgi:uracil-DNA glycosylase family 4
MFVGETPGYNEDVLGRPYSGAAGRLLDSLLNYIDLPRDEVYVTNIVKCRPAGGRALESEEYDVCTKQWLAKEFEAVQPEIVVPLGVAATRYFLGDVTMDQVERVPNTTVFSATIFPMRQPTSMIAEEKGEGKGRNAKIVGNNFMALARLLKDGPAVDELEVNYKYVIAPDGVPQALGDSLVGLDIEWDKEDSLASVQVSKAPGDASFFPAYPDVLGQLDLFLQGCEVVTWNGPGDLLRLRKHGVNFKIAHDGMMAAYVLQLASQGLKPNSREWLGANIEDFKDVFADGFEPTPEGIHYACADADWTLRTSMRLLEEVDKAGLRPVYDLGIRALNLSVDMMEHGVLIDRSALSELDAFLRDQIDTAIAEFERAGGTVDMVNSPKKLAKLLFEDLKLPTNATRKTKLGWSTDKNVLAKLKGRHPVIEAIGTHRKYHKMWATYVRDLPDYIDEDDKRVRMTLKLMTTETGRPAAEKPNLLNQPNRTAEGRKVRDCYVPREGYSFVSIDLSQIELRVLAHQSRDPGLMTAFLSGKDVHAATAADIDHIAIGDVSEDRRRDAKSINFGLSYGMTAPGLLQNLETNGADMTGRNVEWGENFISDFFRVRPGIQKYMRQTENYADDNLFVTSMSGRRRWMFGMLADSQPGLRAASGREAVNMPIQEYAGWIMWHWLLETADAIRHMNAHIWLQIYDSMELEVRDDLVDKVIELAMEALTRVPQLVVPLEAEAKVGKRWGSLVGVKDD